MFDPFPLPLLGSLAAPPPDGAGPGLHLLPFMRWLQGHHGWRRLATVQDGRGLTAPVLPHLAAGDPGCAAALLDEPGLACVAAGSLDAIHVTAERPEPDMAGLLELAATRLAPGGLLLVPHHGQGGTARAGVVVPVGDGIEVAAPNGPTPASDWLAGLCATDLASLGRLFDALGGQAARHTGPSALGMKAVAAQRRTAQRLERTQAEAHAARTDAVLARAERDALYASTSWRLTGPLRRVTQKIKGAPATAPANRPLAADEGAASRDALWDFLTSGHRLVMPAAAAPAVTVLLVLSDAAAHTLACLRAVAATVGRGQVEVIAVDNATSDETARVLDRATGLRVVRNPERGTVAAAVDQGLALALGHAVLLLGPGVQPGPGAVAAALATLDAHPRAGAVGGLLLGTDGRVVGAGEIVDADGTVRAYGQGQPAEMPEFQFRRVVDACSARFLLVRAKALRELGGLNPVFADTGLAGADLCLRLQEAGWQTLFEPLASALDAVDAAAAPAQAGALLAIRHAKRLAGRSSRPLDRRSAAPNRSILVLDDRVPFPELGAGYPRAARLLHELHALGWFVTVFPVDEPQDDWAAVYEQFPREIEFMLGYGRTALAHFLHERDGYYDTVLVSRPHNMRDYLAARAETARPRRLVYDAEAVFATREFLRQEQAGRTVSADARRAALKAEIGLTATADVVTAVNEAEADIFRGAGCPDIAVLGLGVEPAPIGAGFAGRRDLLFVGALGEDASPNADAVAWFVAEIMPLLDQRIGADYRLLVAGRCRAPRVQALASDRVRVLGLVDDLSALYAQARIFVAPTRYAAGLPLKVQESVARGLPVVGTTLLARQLDWTTGCEMMAAGTADEFAACCARLYSDPALWHALRRQGLDRLAQDASRNDFTATLRTVVGEGRAPAT